jgi:hypothetical protein
MTETWKGRPILTTKDMAKMNCPLPPEPEWSALRAGARIPDSVQVVFWIVLFLVYTAACIALGYALAA